RCGAGELCEVRDVRLGAGAARGRGGGIYRRGGGGLGGRVRGRGGHGGGDRVERCGRLYEAGDAGRRGAWELPAVRGPDFRAGPAGVGGGWLDLGGRGGKGCGIRRGRGQGGGDHWLRGGRVRQTGDDAS